MSYIAHLLRHPDQEFHALGLIGAAETEGQDPYAAAQTAVAGLADGLGDAGEMFDAEAKTAYKRRLDELRDELDNAKELCDEERVVAAEEEIDALTKRHCALTQELSRAVWLGGARSSGRVGIGAGPAQRHPGD